MFEIIYRCKDCNEVVRTRERDDLKKDVTVFMPWPCKACIAVGLDSTSSVIPLAPILQEEFQEEYEEVDPEEDGD